MAEDRHLDPEELQELLPDMGRTRRVEQTLGKHLEDHAALDERHEKSLQVLERRIPELERALLELQKAATRDRWIFGVLVVVLFFLSGLSSGHLVNP
jgi:hypothetical protein